MNDEEFEEYILLKSELYYVLEATGQMKKPDPIITIE